MIRINVISEEKSWSKKLKKKEIFFNQICKHFPKKFRFINKKVYLTLLLSNNKKIKILNKKFRNKNKHTDVLSFPFDQKKQNSKEVYLTLLLSNNKNIKILNKKFRKKNKHTDILSFPSGQKTKNLKKIYLGDIIISYNYMNKPKNLTNFEFKKKTIKIFIHGYLHLLGYDHINLKDYQIMYREEKKVFKSIEKLLN